MKIGIQNYDEWCLRNSTHKWRVWDFFAYIIDMLKEEHPEYEIEVCDPFKEECDLALVNSFEMYRMWQMKGKPIRIYYTEENETYNGWFPYSFEEFKEACDYSISFEDDSETNLFFPNWMMYHLFCRKWFLESRTPITDLAAKTKFCTFITSHGGYRLDHFNYISQNYKKIDSIGCWANNMGYGFQLIPKFDTEAEVNFHKPYKFNLCFENTFNPKPNISYVTEKIYNAYLYNTVPIYMGSERVTEWFNPDSFINCNGKTDEEIVEMIRKVDEDDKLYLSMLNTYPFLQEPNSEERLLKFFEKIIKSIH